MNVIIKYFTCLLFFGLLFINHLVAQNAVSVQGKVIDSETQKPLEGVYVSINKTNSGTITNKNGFYQILIPATISNPELVFSYIGSENKIIRLNENKAAAAYVVLKSKPVQFDEVIIVPDSFLKSLLRRAYHNIKNNYPVKPTNGEGFYRESMSQQPDNQLIYFNEGFFKLYTGPYNEAADLQSKLLKSSKHVIANLDSTIDTYRWQSGGIQFKLGDFVLTKEEFIDPLHFRQYNYRIKRQTIFNNDSVYEIEFLPKRGGAKFNGVMYIETKSLAYVAAFYSFNDDFLQDGMGISGSTRLTRTRKTYYQKVEDKWVLREFIYQTSFKDGKSKQAYLKTIEGLNTITSFDGKEGYIPYDERDLERNIFLEQAKVNDSTDWQENTVIVNDSVFNEQFVKSEAIRALDASNKKQETRPKKNFYYYFSNFSLVRDITYYSFNSNVNNIAVISPEFNTLTKTIPRDFTTIQFAGTYYYYLNRKWRVGFAHAKSQSAATVYYKSYELGISYKRNLRKRHKPIFIIPELFFGRTVYGYKLGTIEDARGMKIDGKTIKANSFHLYMSTLEYGGRGNLRLLYNLTSSYKIGLIVSYYQPISTQNSLSVDKANKRDIFYNSGFTLPLNTQDISASPEYRTVSENFFTKGRYSIGLSFFIDFK